PLGPSSLQASMKVSRDRRSLRESRWRGRVVAGVVMTSCSLKEARCIAPVVLLPNCRGWASFQSPKDAFPINRLPAQQKAHGVETPWASSLCRPLAEAESPTMGFDGFADPQAVAELVKLATMARVGAVEMFAFSDEPHLVVARDAVVFQDVSEGAQVGGIDDQKLVLVKLDL